VNRRGRQNKADWQVTFNSRTPKISRYEMSPHWLSREQLCPLGTGVSSDISETPCLRVLRIWHEGCCSESGVALVFALSAFRLSPKPSPLESNGTGPRAAFFHLGSRTAS
jgi:hypothetical protein